MHMKEYNEGWISRDSPMRMRRLSGLVEHFIRRRSSVMRSTEGTSSKLAAAEMLAMADFFSVLRFRVFFHSGNYAKGEREMFKVRWSLYLFGLRTLQCFKHKQRFYLPGQ